MHLFQFNGLNYREIKVKMHLFHLDGLGSAEHRVIAEPSHFQLYREIIPSFHLHSKMGLSGQRLRQIRGELKLYWSQVTDLDTCCKHLEQLLSEQPILNT
ncbi:hypothetical protein J2TS4_44800 [Paenibacillus sp. J2TS4]|nr:hypothetical protein J2TS4_44800 [Paenibacillus sp. J2TS4]